MTEARPTTAEQRSAAVDHICELGALELIDVAELEAATARALTAATDADLAALLDAMPRAISWTSTAGMSDEPRVVEVRGGKTELGRGWQLASTTVLSVAGGHLVIDLGSVSYDDPFTDIVVEARGGIIEVVVPSGVHVVLGDVQRAGGRIDDRLGPSVAIPGMPMVRVSIQVAGGVVRLRRPG